MKASKQVCCQRPVAVRGAHGAGTRTCATSPTSRNVNSRVPLTDRSGNPVIAGAASEEVEEWQTSTMECSMGLDDLVGRERADLVERDPLLLARVAVAHGHCMSLQRLPVH